MRVSVSPAPMPEVRVAIIGVLVRGLMTAINLKSSPSSAIAQITRGIGNIAPRRLPGGETRIYSIHTYTHKNAVNHVNRAHKYREHQTVNRKHIYSLFLTSNFVEHKKSHGK